MEPAGAESAYKSVVERVKTTSQDSLKMGESLIVDILHEKSHDLSRFAKKQSSAVEQLLEGNLTEPSASEKSSRRTIDKLMSNLAQV